LEIVDKANPAATAREKWFEIKVRFIILYNDTLTKNTLVLTNKSFTIRLRTLSLADQGTYVERFAEWV
jgi:hypothetical protein